MLLCVQALGSAITGKRQNAATTDNDELKLSDAWRLLRRNFWLLVLLGFLGAVAGYVISKLSPRVYTATATVEMNKESGAGLGFQDLSGIASHVGIGLEFMTDLLTHQSVLENDNTALSVIERLGLQNQAPYNFIPEDKFHADYMRERGRPLEEAPLTRQRDLRIFHKGLGVEVVKNTRLIEVSYRDSDPKRAALIANTVVDAYINNTTQSRYEATAKTSAWLQDQLDELKRRSEASHSRASDFEQKNGLSDVGVLSSSGSAKGTQAGGGEASAAAQSPVFQRLMTLNESLTRAQVNRIAKEAIYRLTDNSNPDVIINLAESSLGSDGRSATETREIGLLQQLREQESTLKVRLTAEKVKYGAKSTTIQELRDQIANVGQQMATEIANIHKEAEVAYRLALDDENALRARVGEQQEKMTKLGNNLNELSYLQEDEKASRTLYDDLYIRLQQAKVAAGVKSSDIVLVDPARVPGMPSSPVTLNNTVSGFAVGLAFGLLLGVFRAVRDSGLATPSQFASLPHWDVPLLGVVPRFPSEDQQKRFTIRPAYGEGQLGEAWLLRAPRSYVAEAYRGIRTALTTSGTSGDRGSRRKVLMFAGGLPGSGTSTTAYNVAVSLAAQSLRVLLVDADLRQPAIAALAGCAEAPGLSELLMRKEPTTPLAEFLQQHPRVPGLSVLAGGRAQGTSAELLASERFEAFVRAMRERFDYVVLDTAPMLLVTDAAVVARHVDAVALVFASGATTRSGVERMMTTLDRQNAVVTGYVLNRYEDARHESGYPVYVDNTYYEDFAKRLAS